MISSYFLWNINELYQKLAVVMIVTITAFPDATQIKYYICLLMVIFYIVIFLQVYLLPL